MSHMIKLVSSPCGRGSCPTDCPKQLGEHCGGAWATTGICDSQWLKCANRFGDVNQFDGRGNIGRCVRKDDNGSENKSKESQEVNDESKDENPNVVPV